MSYSLGLKKRLLGIALAAIGVSSSVWANTGQPEVANEPVMATMQSTSIPIDPLNPLAVPPDYHSNPGKKYPTVMLIAGSGSDMGPISDMAGKLAVKGFIVYRIEHGKTYPELLADIKNDIASVRAGNPRIDADKVSMLGFSAGGLFSFLSSLDASNNIRCAAGVAPATNLSPYIDPEGYLPAPLYQVEGHPYNRAGEIRRIAAELFSLPTHDYLPSEPGFASKLFDASPINKINNGPGNQFYMVHSVDDTLVPFQQSVEFTNQFNSSRNIRGGAWCDSYPGDHETKMPDDTEEQIVYFLKQCTGAPNTGGVPDRPAQLQRCAGTTPPPLCSITASPSSLPASGGTVTFQIACKDNMQISSYAWLLNNNWRGGFGGNQLSWNHTFPANDSAYPLENQVSISVSSLAGAALSTPITITQATNSSVPVCTLSASPSSLPYTGGSVSLSATCTGNPSSYQWKINGVVSPSSTTANLTHTAPANTGMSVVNTLYSVTATNAVGTSTPVQFTVNQAAMSAPNCSIGISSTTLPYTGGALTATASCTGNPTSYDWYVGGGFYTSTIVPTWTDTVGAHLQPAPHYFTVGVIAKNAAGSSNMAQVTITQAAMPAPSCSLSVSPMSLPYTGGQLTGTAYCTGNPTSYRWLIGGMEYTQTGVPTLVGQIGMHSGSQPHYIPVGVIASNAAGSSAVVQVTVTQAAMPAPAKPTVSVNVNGVNKTNGTTTIRTTQSFTFGYTSTSATGCTLTSTHNGAPWLADPGLPASKTYYNVYFPVGTHKVTVTCNGTGGSGSGITTVNVTS